MRVCRFRFEEETLLGFYADDRVIPLHSANEAYLDAEGEEQSLAVAETLLDLLPPDGAVHEESLRLARWIDELDPISLDAIALSTDDVELLEPIAAPGKILLLAGNYAKHVAERGGQNAERSETFPYVFMKPPATTLTRPGGTVILPRVSPNHVDWECELGVVIGRECRDIDEADALEYVAGYTVINDISDRKFKPNPSRKPRERDAFFDWMHGKWHDTFCPMGPCLVSAGAVPDPQNLRIRLCVNGEVKQDASTAEMVFPVAAVVSFISRILTLAPGDVIATGTPAGVGSATNTYLKHGDMIEASIEGIGALMNPVEAERK